MPAPATGRPAASDLTIREHLRELRRRLLYPVATIIAGSILAYVWRAPLIAFLQQPLGQQLYYTSPMGSFEFVMQVCLLVGFLLALPVLCYNLIRFIEPALERDLQRRAIFGVMAGSFILALGGAAFGYYISLPAALHFFNLVGSAALEPLISIDQYFRFLLTYLATFAAIFQLPLILLFINHFHSLRASTLGRWRKYVIVGALCIGLITPAAPDPMSQVILALPIIILYEITGGIIWLINRRTPVTPAQAPAPAPISEPDTVVPTEAGLPRAATTRSRATTARVLDLRSAAKASGERQSHN